MSKSTGNKTPGCARNFMMCCQMTSIIGGDDYNVDGHGNANDIDDGNDNNTAYSREGGVSGEKYDVDSDDVNYVAIDHIAYTIDANNYGVGFYANNDDAKIPKMVIMLTWMRFQCRL